MDKAKECSNYQNTALISNASNVMLNTTQRTSKCTRWIEKRQRNNCQHVVDVVVETARKFQKKKIYFCFIDYAKAFDSADHSTTHSVKFLKRWEYQTTLPVSYETCMQIKKQQLEPDMEQ